MQGAPDEVGGGFAFITAPSADFVPEQARGKPACGVIVIYAGDPQDGEQAFRPLPEWGEPWQPMPYVAVRQLIDMANPGASTSTPRSITCPSSPTMRSRS